MTHELENSHLQYVWAIETDLKAGKSYNKPSVEKLAASFGITNQNLVKELTELAIVRIARSIAQNQSLDAKQRYDGIVKLYKTQVNLSHRTSHSMLLQQYSTPAPIAFLAGEYVVDMAINWPEIGQKTYFEPSAGNGLLTIAFDQSHTYVNEIDDIRLHNLQSQGFKKVTSQNAMVPFVDYYRKFDGVITNPPFGTLDSPVKYDGFEFKTLDHLMALRALDTMKNDGRAAIIIGGHTTWDDKNRIQSGKNRIFFNYLYHHYHVMDVLNLDGHALYSRQGTAFDVRLILIAGRKVNPEGFAPLKTKDDVVIDNFETLWYRVSSLVKLYTRPASYYPVRLINAKAKARLRILKLRNTLTHE